MKHRPRIQPGHGPRRRSRFVLTHSELVAAALVVLALATPLLLALSPPLAAPSSRDRGDLPAPHQRATPVALQVQVLATAPHDPGAFTQGLEVAGDVLVEGTGLRGRSQLRELDPATGVVRRVAALPPALFGEGITVDGPTIWQLTWTDHIALARDRATLAVQRTVPLEREGWGICRHRDHLVTSDGTDQLVLRDRYTFAPLEAISVRTAGTRIDGLNELECTPEGIWANVWPTNQLVRIDPTSGLVTATIDATGLLPPDQRSGADVLNGIASIPGTDQYWLTGKNWPTTYRVRFVRAGPPEANLEHTHERLPAVLGRATHLLGGPLPYPTGPASPSAVQLRERSQGS